MDEAPVSHKRQIVVALAVLIIVVVIVAGIAVAAKNKNKVASPASSPAPATTSSPVAPTGTNTSSFKDGNYTGSGSYDSPGGTESITVKITLKNGVVTDTSAVSGANDPTAKQYQSDFISSYKQQVVGKQISSLKLSRVSGSSLTSQGFNSAIQQIEAQAKA